MNELVPDVETLAQRLGDAEETILAELSEVQGRPVDLGGYYFVDKARADEVMRPSRTFNEALTNV